MLPKGTPSYNRRLLIWLCVLRKPFWVRKWSRRIWVGLRSVQPNSHTNWGLGSRDVRKRMRRVLLRLFLAPATIKKRKHSNQPKLITYPIQSHPSTQREVWRENPPSRERKLLCACFVAVLVTWMSFASILRELGGGVLSKLETHIMMSSLISCLVLILTFCLAFTLVLHLTLLHRFSLVLLWT
jgi:hypothetical protein